MKNLALVPARSGSKGLPNKNIRPLCGKPLIAYSIETAVRSGLFDTVHLSTDSPKYAEIGKRYGADAPFLRSVENSSDMASSWDMVLEVLDNYAKLGIVFDTVMLLQPTSPLRTCDNIAAAFELMEQKNANAIVSVCQADYPPTWYNQLPENGIMTNFIRDEADKKRRQDAAVFYRINGAIFLTKIAYFYTYKDIYHSACFAYIMDKSRSVDIDDELDFLFAESVLKHEGKLCSTPPSPNS